MDTATIWWLLVGITVAAELMTGTFYLLMLAIGLVAGAVAAHLNAPLNTQLLLAAVVGAGSVALWHWRRQNRAAAQTQAQSEAQNPDLHLDVGERVQVLVWQADGTARVQYRGATWQVRAEAGTLTQPGTFRIVGVQGNALIVRAEA